MSESQELLIGLVSISDRASSGVYQDQGIPALTDWLKTALTSPFEVESRLIADERSAIEAAVHGSCDAPDVRSKGALR